MQQSEIRNRLLALFPPKEFRQVASMLKLVELPVRFAFMQPDEISEFSYFPEIGIGSIVAPSPEGQRTEIGSSDEKETATAFALPILSLSLKRARLSKR